MKLKTLIAVAVAGAFAVPFAAQASVDNDRIVLAQASGGGSAGGAGGAGGAAGAPGGASSGAAASGAPGASSGAGGTSGEAASGAPGTGPGTPPTDMQQLDANNDGYVSREEAARVQGFDTRFSELDKDNDGRISRSEWNAGMGSAAGTGATTGQSSDPARGVGTAGSRPAPSSGSTTK